MKTKLIALVSAFAACLASASPSATQNWVKKYVATNCVQRSSSTLDPTVVTVYDNDGTPSTVTFNWTRNTNEALRVMSSNVEGMTNGLVFAKMNDKSYFNATNYTCNYITGNVECVRMVFTSAVDRVIGGVTNRVYTGTNFIYDIVYYANVNGAEYRSFKANSRYYFQPISTNVSDKLFTMCNTYISDITRKKIVTDNAFSKNSKRRFSFFELFFNTAFADWGEWEGPIGDTWKYPPNPAFGETYYIMGKYQRHYYTDDIKTYSINTITWQLASGDTATYTIDYELPFTINAGIDICDLGNNVFNTDTYTGEWLLKQLESILPRSRYIQISRSDPAKNALDNKIKEIVRQYNDEIEYLSSITCPQEEDKVLEEGVADCNGSHLWTGTCGNWVCMRCGLKDTEPSSHNYGECEENNVCDICQNEHTGDGTTAKCNFRPNEISHHRGWAAAEGNWLSSDGNSFVCRCVCQCYNGKTGFCFSHKDPQTADGYFCGADNICYRNWTCDRCGLQVHHNTLPSSFPGSTVSPANHSFSGGGMFRQVITNDVNMCSANYTCDHSHDVTELQAEGCGANIVELMDHDPDNENKHAEQIPDDNYEHNEICPCAHGYGTTGWCGYSITNTVAHKYDYSRSPGKPSDAFYRLPTSTHHFNYRACADVDGNVDYTNYCGFVDYRQEDHSWGQPFYGNPTETQHDISNKCVKCDYVKYIDTKPHDAGDKTYHYVDTENHAISSVCIRAGCEMPFLVALTNHVPWESKIAYRYYDLGDGLRHAISNECKQCNGIIPVAGSPENHYARSVDNVIKYEAKPGAKHDIYKKCVGEGIRSCGAIFVYTNNVDCTSSSSLLTLNPDPNGKDYITCDFCTNHIKDVKHIWWFNNSKHKCTNDGGHLEVAHEPVNGSCYCGWTTGMVSDVEYEYQETQSAVFCKCGYCTGDIYSSSRIYATNGVVIAEEDRGPWSNPSFVSQGTCKYNENNFCRCPYCRDEANPLVNECYCRLINENGIVKLTDETIYNIFYRYWAYGQHMSIDFSDPVIKIGPGCFEEAFISMPNLVLANMSATRDIGERSFKRAFTNSTNLSEVKFNSLTNAGDYAFNEAFVGCNMNYGINLNSLKTAGDGCFDGAFADTKIRAIELPELEVINDSYISFFGTKTNMTVNRLDLSKLKVATDGSYGTSSIIDFAMMPNLEYILLSQTDTNVISKIGDLSGLKKVKKIDFHLVNGIPAFTCDVYSYKNHLAPTNSQNYMIVVPDALYDAWIVAEGWATVASHIVPYSNQVIHRRVTVTFNSDGGDYVAPITIREGTGITPTNITKFAIASGGAADGGFIFNGWFTDSSKTIPYVNGTAISNDTTLYAKFTDNRHIEISDQQYPIESMTSGMYYINVAESIENIRIAERADYAVEHRATGELLYYDKTLASPTITTNYVNVKIFIDESNPGVKTVMSDDFDCDPTTTGPWKFRVSNTGRDGVVTIGNWSELRYGYQN